MAVSQEILEALTTGIQSEVAAYVFYLEAIKKLADDNLKPTFEILAGEEKKHFQILEGQYDSLVRSEKWISTADVLKQDGLPEIDEDMAEKHKDLIANIRKLETKREVLNMALKLEEEAKALFVRLGNEAKSDEARKTFEHLAGFEEGHVKLVKNMLVNLVE